MSEGVVTCPRCHESVSELCFVPPDLLTRDIIEEVESDDQHLTDDGGMEICGDCMADLDGD
jgi:hypothetical protein